MTPPCYNCGKRVVGCHSTCEDYKTFKAEILERKQKIRVDLEVTNYVVAGQVKAKAKIAERKKNSKIRRYKK